MEPQQLTDAIVCRRHYMKLLERLPMVPTKKQLREYRQAREVYLKAVQMVCICNEERTHG